MGSFSFPVEVLVDVVEEAEAAVASTATFRRASDIEKCRQEAKLGAGTKGRDVGLKCSVLASEKLLTESVLNGVVRRRNVR